MGLSTSTKPEQVQTLSKQQLQNLNALLGGVGGLAPQQFGAIQSQLDPQAQIDFFQKAVADPSLKQFQQQVIPQILEAAEGLGSKGGSAIEGQLIRAGENLQENLASQLAQFQVGQQQQGLQNLLGINQLGLGTQPFALQQPGLSPLAQFILGLGGAGAQGLGAAAGAGMISSQDYKENISDYEDTTDKVMSLKVKKYDYKDQFGGRKDCIGLIQEECPEELQIEQNGLKMVDVYGLCSMLVKAVQQLTAKVEALEAK